MQWPVHQPRIATPLTPAVAVWPLAGFDSPAHTPMRAVTSPPHVHRGRSRTKQGDPHHAHEARVTEHEVAPLGPESRHRPGICENY